MRTTMGLAAIGVFTIAALTVAPAVMADEATGDIYADIHVELDLPGYGGTGAIVFEANDVLVGDGVELSASEGSAVSNPSSWCGGVTLDISSDLQTLTIASPSTCGFFTASYSVTLTGAKWGTMSVTSDTLWGAGSSRLTAGATDYTFAATYDANGTAANGTAAFAFTAPTLDEPVVVDDPPADDDDDALPASGGGAVPVAADVSFTG